MRTVGLLGGMSWESSVEYERVINTEVRRRLGGAHSGDLLVRSYDFAAVEALQSGGEWEAAGRMLAGDARRLVEAGAAAVMLCTNTMHLVADQVEEAIDVPLLHIADATAAAAHDAGVHRVALLGTRVTMERDFMVARLARSGLAVVVPDEPDRTTVHEVIYRELVRGVVDDGSRAAYLGVIDRLVATGADGVVAGCTEIELLVGPEHVAVPFFPTARLHALAAVEFMLAG